jgi:hypothetical protein
MDTLKLCPKICSVCGGIKRYLLNKVAYESNADIILTAHHLDDFLVRMLKSVLNAEVDELVRLKPYLPTNETLLQRAGCSGGFVKVSYRGMLLFKDSHLLMKNTLSAGRRTLKDLEGLSMF